MNARDHRRGQRPWAGPAAIFAVLLAAGLWVVQLDVAQREADRDRLMASQGAEVRAELEEELFRSINLARGLRAFVVAHPELPDRARLEVLLADLYEQGDHVRNIGLAPNNVLEVVYPLAGNEGAVGLRYEDVPEQYAAVERAMQLRSTVLAGPVDLVQGGRGLINRTPVFLADGSYWGMVSLVLDVDSLIEKVRLDTLALPVEWAARAVAASGDSVFLGGDRQAFDEASDAAASARFEVPDGVWEVVIRGDGATSLLRTALLAGLAVVAAAAFSALVLRARVEHLKVTEMSLHDTLTGLPNRRLLVDRFEHALATAGREDEPVTLLFGDLDSFKQINDVHGHEAGDVVLQTVAERLRARLRGADTVARVGGDEFVLVLPGTTTATAQAVIDDLQASLAWPIPWRDTTLHVSAAWGSAEFPRDGTDLDALLSAADGSMYRAKQARRQLAASQNQTL